MIVALETRVLCPECGHKIPYHVLAVTVRVNRRSLRPAGNGPMIGWLEHWECPGCGKALPRDRPLDREPYRLTAEDAVKVAEYRKRRWGIESTGADVERVAV